RKAESNDLLAKEANAGAFRPKFAALNALLAGEAQQRLELEQRCARLDEEVQVQAAITDDWRVRCEELEVKLAGAEKAREVARTHAETLASVKAEAQRQIAAAHAERDQALARATPRPAARASGEDAAARAKDEVAALKKKLVQAEAALEAAAQLRSKVAKLEEALRQAKAAPPRGKTA
ncbi:MAG: hypothetical protein ACK4N5_18655, partial [Myxococcales bacterium]